MLNMNYKNDNNEEENEDIESKIQKVPTREVSIQTDLSKNEYFLSSISFKLPIISKLMTL